MTQSHLSEEELSHLKKKMEKDQTQVNKRIAELESQDPYVDPDHANDNAANDREASEEEGHDRIGAQLEELKNQKADIEKALSKMELGTYGICEVTGQAIPVERLRVFPTAATIVLPEK